MLIVPCIAQCTLWWDFSQDYSIGIRGIVRRHSVGEAAPNIMGTYRKTSTVSRTLVGNKIVDNSDVVGASPVGAAPTTSSFST